MYRFKASFDLNPVDALQNAATTYKDAATIAVCGHLRTVIGETGHALDDHAKDAEVRQLLLQHCQTRLRSLVAYGSHSTSQTFNLMEQELARAYGRIQIFLEDYMN